MAKGKYQEWLTPDGLLLIEGWAREGLTEEQIAKNMGCAYSSLCRWKEEYSVISEALKRGKAPVDMQVENALLKRALGYEYEEVTEIVEFADGNTKKTNKTVKKLVLPDVTAQIFWLKNRRPDRWRDTKNIENKSDGVLTKLIEGLQVPDNDIHEETTGTDENVANAETEENKPS